MFVLFSSNAERLFQRGILEALALPKDHPRTFRYQVKYVADKIKDALRGNQVEQLLKENGRDALIVYAQCPTGSEGTYQYCPVRFATIASLRLLGDIVFAELRLQGFPNFINWSSNPEREKSFDTWLSQRTGAINPVSRDGEFCTIACNGAWDLSDCVTPEEEVWQKVVDRLAKMSSMSGTLFYRIRGFFYPSSSVFHRNSFSETPITPRSTPGDLTYRIKMSKPVDLKLLFYRPAEATPKTIKATFEVEADKSGFSEVPTPALRLESRYDELTVRLATKRVFDNTLAPVAIRLKEADCANVLTCEPMLMCVVQVPHFLLALLLICFFLAPTLLATSAPDISSVLLWSPRFATPQGVTDAVALSVRSLPYVKVAGGFFAAIAAWLAFRRFPLK